MVIFKTDRLIVRKLEKTDQNFFTELLTNRDIIDAIPHKAYPQEEIDNRFQEFLSASSEIEQIKRNVWGITEKDKSELIGLCLFLTNNEKDRELGYRFRKPYWGKGYGSEITKGIIDFAFNTLKLPKITADVWVENKASTKILEKYLHSVKEFYNERDACVDRRYEITFEDWHNR
jgi:RimJ/RimL family protein N-acetyltransferase